MNSVTKALLLTTVALSASAAFAGKNDSLPLDVLFNCGNTEIYADDVNLFIGVVQDADQTLENGVFYARIAKPLQRGNAMKWLNTDTKVLKAESSKSIGRGAYLNTYTYSTKNYGDIEIKMTFTAASDVSNQLLDVSISGRDASCTKF